MKHAQIIPLLEDLIKKLEHEKYQYISMSDSTESIYQNFISLCVPLIKEHIVFLNQAINITSVDEGLKTLEYIKILFMLKSEEITEEQEKIILDSARDRLKQAGVAFKNADYSGVSNKLNTSVELALKDILNIPTTINGINVSKIIDIMISEKIGPIDYLKEVKKHVLMDNLVKHQGVAPVESRAVMAISATENLIRKLPKEPFNLSEEIKEKIFSGIN